MIPRYTPPELAQLWSDANKYATWLEVELAACEAMEHPDAGLVPPGTAGQIGFVLRISPSGARPHQPIGFVSHI